MHDRSTAMLTRSNRPLIMLAGWLLTTEQVPRRAKKLWDNDDGRNAEMLPRRTFDQLRRKDYPHPFVRHGAGRESRKN